MTPEEAKKTWRNLARQHHPDAGGDAETFKRIQAEYEAYQKKALKPAPTTKVNPANWWGSVVSAAQAQPQAQAQSQQSQAHHQAHRWMPAMQKSGRSISKTLMCYIGEVRGAGLYQEADIVATLVDQLARLNYVRIDRSLRNFCTSAMPSIERHGKGGKATTGDVIAAYIAQLRTLGGYDVQVRVLDFVLGELKSLGLVK